MEKYGSFSQETGSSTFRQQIVIEKKESIYKAEGRFTFFIPVDEGFKPVPRPRLIDRLVIDGHVIPYEVLFTAPTPDNVQYPTLVFSDNLKVVISFSKSQNKVYVQSNTLVGDATHTDGVVLAEIVKGNIPVRNGVVHLIARPLMVVDNTVRGFLEVSAQPSVLTLIHEHPYQVTVDVYIRPPRLSCEFLKRSGGRITNAEIINSLIRDITLIQSIYLWNHFAIK
ncbi:Fasciclin-1 [Acromyrmex echinatior]|uniref:Fasciclin-1 n=1 Tax=Acromyrmex echinatior TaxID=103372 RepID=F4WXV8_ACREC|nr:Fasciclin-1 [Acromyrmex echinatior]